MDSMTEGLSIRKNEEIIANTTAVRLIAHLKRNDFDNLLFIKDKSKVDTYVLTDRTGGKDVTIIDIGAMYNPHTKKTEESTIRVLTNNDRAIKLIKDLLTNPTNVEASKPIKILKKA
ncbi:MAG: hypothetical protein Q7S22_02540 [Candidatus Micrarchaeota archaeon]|nr:hypothetical protein [Candidatus Micrarchaeota archaeon]